MLSMAAKYKRFNLMLKYADYQQGELVSARTTPSCGRRSNSSGNSCVCTAPIGPNFLPR